MQFQALLDINGRFGRGAFGPGEFPTAAALVDHLDYLGIDRALAWHYRARDLNPATGNRALLAELAATPAADGRLFPAFVLTPADCFEHGAMAALRAFFRERAPRALRLFPQSSRFDPRTVERALAALAGFRPLVLVDFRELCAAPGGCRALEELASRFPAVAFAITEIMWGHFNSAIDLLWRAANVYIDISWLHMRESIEFLRDEFGAERILFGTGFKAHYGAAIAALAHARLTDEERRLVAAGNAERLLGLPPAPAKAAPGRGAADGAKPLWRTFRAGHPVPADVTVVDAHAHTGPHARGWIIRDTDPRENRRNLIAQMDRCGVTKTIIVPEGGLFGDPPADCAAAETLLAAYRERFAGYLPFNPWYAAELVPALDGFFERGFYLGFKILASYWRRPVTDGQYRPAWAYADRHEKPILLHTWKGMYDSPEMLEAIVPAHPGAKFLLGHSGGGGRRAAAIALARGNPNVYLEFCGSFTTPEDWTDTIAQAGRDRVVFGSDTGAHDLAWELGRFLSIPLPDAILKPALGENFISLLHPADRARHFNRHRPGTALPAGAG